MQMTPHIPDRARIGGDRSKSSNFLLCFEEIWSSHAYWAFAIAIGRSRLWIGRSRFLLGVLGYGLGVPKEIIRGDFSRRLFEGDYSKEWRTRYFLEWYLNLVPELWYLNLVSELGT